jgi:hypothetical protein
MRFHYGSFRGLSELRQQFTPVVALAVGTIPVSCRLADDAPRVSLERPDRRGPSWASAPHNPRCASGSPSELLESDHRSPPRDTAAFVDARLQAGGCLAPTKVIGAIGSKDRRSVALPIDAAHHDVPYSTVRRSSSTASSRAQSSSERKALRRCG